VISSEKSEASNLTGEQQQSVPDKRRTRIAVIFFFFSMGLVFSSWASRIPEIKTKLNLNDAVFGSILFCLPIAQFLMMTFSGKIVTRFGPRKVALFALPAYAICLTNIGLVSQGWQLAIALFLFGIAGNLCNISVNTQGVSTEKLYGRSIMATFHGGWSIAGFAGALVGILMINININPYWHYVVVFLIVCAIIFFNHDHLIKGKIASGKSETGRKFFNKPDRSLVALGVIGFFSMASEGTMFDWSGIYFKDVVEAPSSLVIVGYASFMIMMATGRFVADSIIAKIGRKRLMQICGIMISSGLYLAVLFPYLITSTIAFMIVGLGVSSIIPSVYSAAGRNESVPPGIAIATVASVSYFGFLMGPPVIGYISEAFGLRYSFSLVGIFGIGITLMVSRIRSLHT
jgi:MFS family permease